MNSRTNGRVDGQPPGQTTDLTLHDREDIEIFRSRVGATGYDRLVIHLADPAANPPSPAFVSAHRTGEAWSRWGFGRLGNFIFAWNSLNAKDAGIFASMLEALECVLQDPEGLLRDLDVEE